RSKGQQIKLKGFFTCQTDFVVYLLKCPCGLGYVGKTICDFKERVSQHKTSIRIFHME
ncbi:Hypothetical predicted protein, partial [Pelobates cultripes]